MVAAIWRENEFHLRRIVLAEHLSAYYASEVRALAESLGVPVSLDETLPQPGDLWVASYPDPTAPGRPEDVQWVSALEVPIAVYWLRELASRRTAAQLVG